jgi:TolB protein
MARKFDGRAPLLMLFSVLGVAQTPQDLGPFVQVSDIGDLSRKTLVTFERSSGIYFVSASGESIWGERDAFGFVSKPMKGDAAIGARVRFMSKGGHEHRKAGVMFRQSLAPDAVYADVVVHGNGLTSLQYRAEAGGSTREIQCDRETPTAIRLEKRGDYLQVFTANEDGVFGATGCLIKVTLRGTFHAGLVVSAHDNSAFENARFSSVTVGPPPERRSVRVSALEIVPLDSLDRRVVWYSAGTLEVPSFTVRGDAICFREDGQLKKLALTGRSEPRLIGMENIEECATAPAVFSAGEKVVHAVVGGRASIYREKPGGDLVPLARDERHNWQPRMAPDATSYVYFSGTAKPDRQKPVPGDYLLLQKPLAGGDPRLLAAYYGGPGSLGVSPFSPDGKRVVFVSREPD